MDPSATLSAEDSVLVGKIIGLLRSLQPNWSDAPFSTIRDRLGAILGSVPRTRHGLARRNAMLQTMLRLTQLYHNQTSAAIKFQYWHGRTTQRLLLAKYTIHVASIRRQQAEAQLQTRQSASRIIQQSFVRYLLWKQIQPDCLEIKALARARADAAAILRQAKPDQKLHAEILLLIADQRLNQFHVCHFKLRSRSTLELRLQSTLDRILES